MTLRTALLPSLAILSLLPLSPARAQVVPKPNCDNVDRIETGMSGETTAAEIASGANKLGFTCNTQLVGQYQGEGASWQLTAWKNCAYFDQRLTNTEKNPGTVVVDVSDPTNPKPTAWLNTPAMLDPWESVKVNPTRQLLAGGQRPTASLNFPGTGFAIYDISQDCAHPTLLSSVDFSGSFGHSGQWAPDGKTYYITPLRGAGPSLEAIDTSDAANPKVIPCGPAGVNGCNAGFWTAQPPLNPTFHDLEFSKDGNTAYATMFATGATLSALNGLIILDVSDFQQRRANPAFRVISTLTWDDGSQGAQNALPITIAGKPYILFADEGGNTGSCSQGKSLSGFPRLIDISDPKNPKTVSKIMLDVHDPANCSKFAATNVVSGGPSFFGYSCHYCNVDDVDNATKAVCNCFAAGMRIFDIRDPVNPKEIGYFKPPAQGTKLLPGSQYANQGTTGPTFTRNYDWATSKVSFPKDRGMPSGDIWTTSQDNGFMVVRMNHLTSGCNNAGATFGVVALLALMPLVQRLRRRK